jgi:hypothetical protein
MNVLCRLLIWSWLVTYWLSEYRRKKRDQAQAQGLMAVATSGRPVQRP